MNRLKKDKIDFNSAFSDDFSNTDEKLVFSDNKSNTESNKFVVAKTEGPLSGFYDWIRCLLFAIAVVVLFLTFVFRLVDVEGSSMSETLTSNDKVVVSNLFYTPENNDIVVISHGAEYSKPIIKRVIATEGQSIKLDFENNRIIVDGVILDEDYIKGTTFGGVFAEYEIPEVVPEGKVFVMGDNREVSMDSRSTKIGLIDTGDVIGKAQFVVFPLSNLGYLY